MVHWLAPDDFDQLFRYLWVRCSLNFGRGEGRARELIRLCPSSEADRCMMQGELDPQRDCQ